MLVHTIFVLIFTISTTSLCSGDIASDLTSQFNDLSLNCVGSNNETRPAYECSGLLLRAFNPSRKKFPWSVKDLNVERNTAPFTLLRRDQPFDRFPLGYECGMIVYPQLKTPQNKKVRNVYCAFPVDAMTDFREGGHGCGKTSNDNDGSSEPCKGQGITSYDAWVKHYDKIMSSGGSNRMSFMRRQCGFDMVKDPSDFEIIIEARSYLKGTNWEFFNNEVVLEGWDQDKPQDLAIQALFYSLTGKDVASLRNKTYEFQRVYAELTGGEMIPVVGIKLPTKQNPDITIENN